MRFGDDLDLDPNVYPEVCLSFLVLRLFSTREISIFYDYLLGVA